tara:strand:- start:648 stop:776 length:129 start_codon:yes stop_codon:yes gene_type:complete
MSGVEQKETVVKIIKLFSSSVFTLAIRCGIIHPYDKENENNI